MESIKELFGESCTPSIIYFISAIVMLLIYVVVGLYKNSSVSMSYFFSNLICAFIIFQCLALICKGGSGGEIFVWILLLMCMYLNYLTIVNLIKGEEINFFKFQMSPAPAPSPITVTAPITTPSPAPAPTTVPTSSPSPAPTTI